MQRLVRQVLVILCLLGYSWFTSAAIDAYEFESEEKAQEFRELTLQLRCPKCQNNSIGDSNAVIATDMRAKVYELMQQGYTKQQVIDYMVERYGHFVTYQPPVNILTLILWIGPLLFLVFAVYVVFRISRRKQLVLHDSTSELSEQERLRLKQLLNETPVNKE